eukprot:CAMPEP_0202978324 /NCGR_PEP_ID=MMETSP1396-20130829/84784_1 /ASSEMBLY_ACC=CAM_ASM_000872 /TAXON_ID= /ORGANISM="Pseudokeronopsis sp., Strain Brazil" /LENGTH=60 /DNA_ID=CAMNT_0049717255 /DNA_START=1832 /DNA_END=2014 /DNA_ORIENTATION=-
MPVNNEYFSTISFATYIIGLLDYYDLTGEEEALELARINFQPILEEDLLWNDDGLVRDGF